METLNYIYSASLDNPTTWPLVFGLTGLWLASALVIVGWAVYKLLGLAR